jgi:hypothetical protein
MKELMKIVRCKLGDKIHGPMQVSELRRIPGFTLSCLVSAESKDEWEPAFKTIDLTVYFQNHTPVAREPIDLGLLSAVANQKSDGQQNNMVVTGDTGVSSLEPAMPESQPEPKRRRKPLIVAMMILISGCVYGAIRIAAPLIHQSLFAHSVAMPNAPVESLPVATIPTPAPLIPVAAPVKKEPNLKMSVHPRKHAHAHKTHKKKHKKTPNPPPISSVPSN